MAIGDRIKLARELGGMSLRELGEAADLSAMAISKYENHRATPRSGALIRLARALDVSVEFFLRPPLIHRTEQLWLRKQPTLDVEEERAILRRVHDWLERYIETEELLLSAGLGESARFTMPEGFPCRIHSLEESAIAASALRDVWGLGVGPLASLTELLEYRHIKVAIVEAHRDFDACAFWAHTDHPIPVIAVRGDAPGDRQRFSLVYGLAHLILEVPTDWSEEERNKVPGRFAAAFIVPEAAVRFELGQRRQAISLCELHKLKHKYGASMQTWIYRAKSSGVISDAVAAELLKPFKAVDWSEDGAVEPGVPLPSEETSRLRDLLVRALSEGVIGQRRASELLGKPFEQFSREVACENAGLPLTAGR